MHMSFVTCHKKRRRECGRVQVGTSVVMSLSSGSRQFGLPGSGQLMRLRTVRQKLHVTFAGLQTITMRVSGQ